MNRDVPIRSRVPLSEGRPLLVRAFDYAMGETTGRHLHDAAQLVYAVSGTMTVMAEQGLWVVPSLRAVWIPAGLMHEVVMQSPVSMRTAYLDPAFATKLPGSCVVVSVSPLLRELLIEASRFPEGCRYAARCRLVIDLLLEELRVADQLPLSLPKPQDPRLRRVTEALRQSPGDPRSLESWAAAAGASKRTLARLFERETGMSFRQWRQQARLLTALQKLANGEAVSAVAMDLGYATPSAFTQMFRQALGVVPSAYFKPSTSFKDEA